MVLWIMARDIAITKTKDGVAFITIPSYFVKKYLKEVNKIQFRTTDRGGELILPVDIREKYFTELYEDSVIEDKNYPIPSVEVE